MVFKRKPNTDVDYNRIPKQTKFNTTNIRVNDSMCGNVTPSTQKSDDRMNLKQRTRNRKTITINESQTSANKNNKAGLQNVMNASKEKLKKKVLQTPEEIAKHTSEYREPYSIDDLAAIGFIPYQGSANSFQFQHIVARSVVYQSSVVRHPQKNITGMPLLQKNNLSDRNSGRRTNEILSTTETGSTSTLEKAKAAVRGRKPYSRGARARNSGIDLLKKVPAMSAVLANINSCVYCNAIRFIHETTAFCCSNGTVSLAYSEPPPFLYELLTSNTELSKHFRKYVRGYNNMMAFTSLGVNFDKRLATSVGTGVYVFKVQGQMYHFINSILPVDSTPEYLQLYFYDADNELENRTKISKPFEKTIVQILIDLSHINPYAKFFRTLRDEPDLENVKIVIKADPKKNQKVYNLPTQDEVAMIWKDSGHSSDIQPRDIVIFGNDVSSYRIQYYFGCYDPLQYFILFPHGETGWHGNIEKADKQKDRNVCAREKNLEPQNFQCPEQMLEKESQAFEKSKTGRHRVAIREYYAYKLQIRPLQKSLLHKAGRLFQQYIVDMYVKIETSRLDFFRFNQEDIRADLYQGVVEALAAGETSAANVGKRIILPSTFIGGPRDMTRRYLDAMTLVRKYGRPDLFITMTCNPHWPEIADHLAEGESAQDRPDLTARVFKAKLIELKDEINEKKIFGPVAALVHVIEFQKRGLPHAHILLILDGIAKLNTPAQYDQIVSAEIPNEIEQPHLHNMVKQHMMHGPCGSLNSLNVCMINGKCKSHYPKPFQEETTNDQNEYPLYRRRNNGRTVFVRKHHLHNGYVVPHCPYLVAKFNCHINVEVCSTIRAVKYLYKYIYKGHDRIAFDIMNDKSLNGYDEIAAFQSGRWVSPPEAAWRIFAFPMYSMNPSVMSLQIHLENEQLVTFRPKNDLNDVIRRERASKTTLTEFFEMNMHNAIAQELNLLYTEFPEKFVWNQEYATWTLRKQKFVTGRINSVSPLEGERYYLRLLLTEVRGPKSFTDLLTVDGLVASSFREAATLRGLVLDDKHINLCLEEACLLKMPFALRQLFASLLVFCNPSNPKHLWTKFETHLSEDFARDKNMHPEMVRKKTLNTIAKLIDSMGKNILDYGLAEDFETEDIDDDGKEMKDEMSLPINYQDLNSANLLNHEQRLAFDLIMSKITNLENGCFFIDGPGGTGKTFLYRALLAKVRSQNKIALATASSGVAASLLPGGRTAHSRFKIPLDFSISQACSVGKRTGLADLIRKASLIIWDEASMAHRQIIEAFNEMLKDINSTNCLFGGKVVVFGGDFRQILPVVRYGAKAEAIEASLVSSPLWKFIKKIHLTENMRARMDPEFSAYLMRIGNGSEPTKDGNRVKIPTSLLIRDNDKTDLLDTLIEHVFPNLKTSSNDWLSMMNRALLTPRNESVNEINRKIIDRFSGDYTTYKAFDETTDPKQQSQYEELLHSLGPNGIPPYELKLKVNCPVMLMRNINPSIGLCNGTRLICKGFQKNLVHATIATGDHEGTDVLVHRIPMQPTATDGCPVSFKRTQFPLKPCFCMTVNKAQGQTLEYVGLYLPQPVFSHGQLYVALSRAKTAKSVKILLEHNLLTTSDPETTPNIVHTEIFEYAAA